MSVIEGEDWDVNDEAARGADTDITFTANSRLVRAARSLKEGRQFLLGW